MASGRGCSGLGMAASAAAIPPLGTSRMSPSQAGVTRIIRGSSKGGYRRGGRRDGATSDGGTLRIRRFETTRSVRVRGDLTVMWPRVRSLKTGGQNGDDGPALVK